MATAGEHISHDEWAWHDAFSVVNDGEGLPAFSCAMLCNADVARRTEAAGVEMADVSTFLTQPNRFK